MKIKELIKSLDLFGLEVKLKFNNDDTQKSLVGGILSLMVLLLTSVAAYTLISAILFKKSVEVSTSTEYRNEAQKVNILDRGYTFQFSLIKARGVQPVDVTMKHITVKGAIYKRNYDRESSGISLSTPFLFDYVPCRDVKNSIKVKYLKRHIEPLAESKMNALQICPNLDDTDISQFVVGGNSGFADDFAVVLLHVYPCVGGPNKECVDESELEGIVSPIRIPRFTFEPEDVANPIKEVDMFDQIPLALGRLSFFNFTLRQELIEDESVYNFRPMNVKAELLEVDHKHFDAKPRTLSASPCSISPNTGIFGVSCEPLLSITFQIGGTVIHRKRNFGKILNTFGEVGGIFEVIMLVFALIFICFKCYVKGEKQIIKEGVYEEGELEKLLDFNRRYETGFEDMKLNQEIVNELLKENQDGFLMFKEVQKIKVLNEAIFEDYHKALLPLLIFRLKAKEKQKKKQKENRPKTVKNQKIKLTLDEAIKKLKRINPEKSEMTSQLDKYFLKILEVGSYPRDQVTDFTAGNISRTVGNERSSSTLVRGEDNHLIFEDEKISDQDHQKRYTKPKKMEKRGNLG